MTQTLPDQIDELVERYQSFHLSTLNSDGLPEASYTPYLYHQDRFYIFISELSAHTRNLAAEPQCSALVIEDESASETIFARKRLQVKCEAQFVERSDPLWNTVTTLMTERHGELMHTLMGLSDFKLFALRIGGGSFVKGFGQAYRFEGSSWQNLEHQRPKT